MSLDSAFIWGLIAVSLGSLSLASANICMLEGEKYLTEKYRTVRIVNVALNEDKFIGNFKGGNCKPRHSKAKAPTCLVDDLHSQSETDSEDLEQEEIPLK